MKKILFLTFSYIPYNVTGTFRVMRFIKYLPKYGIRPFVVTADQGKHHWNEKLFDEVPKEAKIYRFRSFFKDSQSRTQKKMKKNKKDTFFKNFFTTSIKMFKDLFFSPDILIIWHIRHAFKIIKLIKKENIKLCYSSAYPFSSLIFIAFIKKILKVKIITDFRDPWKDNHAQLNQTLFRMIHNIWMEKFVICQADLLVTTTKKLLDTFEMKYPCLRNGINIPNGFDEDEFEFLPQSKIATNKKIIIYAGKFDINNTAYNPEMIICAIKAMIEDNLIDFELHVYGHKSEATIELIKKFNLRNYIKLKGFIWRNELIQKESHADAFLHFYYPAKLYNTISLKIFEYSQFKVPILSINTKMSEMSNFIKKSNLGFVCENDNIEEIKKSFEKLLSLDKKEFKKNINYDYLQKFNVKKQAKILSDEIKKL